MGSTKRGENSGTRTFGSLHKAINELPHLLSKQRAGLVGQVFVADILSPLIEDITGLFEMDGA